MMTKSKTGTTYDYRWTAAGLMDSVRVAGTGNHLYYDAFGRFVGWNQGTTKIRRLVWEGGNLLVETNGAMTMKQGEYSYVPGALDVLHAYIDSTATEQHYAHEDGTGNVVATTTSGKVLKQSLAYDVWGKKTALTEPTGYEQRAWWKGALAFQRANKFNLTYKRNRWYDPDLGRFISEDPIGLAGGIKNYVLAANDPVNGRDPTGLSSCIYTVWIRYYTDTGAIISSNTSAFCVGGGGSSGGNGQPLEPPLDAPCDLFGASVDFAINVTLDAASLSGVGLGFRFVGRGVAHVLTSGTMMAAQSTLSAGGRRTVAEGLARTVTKRRMAEVNAGASTTLATGSFETVAGLGLLGEGLGLQNSAAEYRAMGARSIWDNVPVVGSFTSLARLVDCAARTASR